MKKVLIFVFLVLTFYLVKGQETPKEKKWNYNFGIGYLKTKVKNENVWNDEVLTSNSKNKPVIEIQVSRKLGNGFNFFFGMSFEQYATVSESDGIFKSGILKTDADGYYYYPYFETEYTEERKVSLIGFPVGLRVLAGNPQKAELLIEVGIKPSMVPSAKFIEKGSYERKGYYPDANYYNVFHILEDIDVLDYKKYSKNADNELGIKSFLFNTFIAAGITSPVSNKTAIYIKGYFTTSIGDVNDAYNKDISYVNLLGVSKSYQKTTLFGIGFMFGVILK
ncbi:MAG: hypothetical protein ACHQNT_07775 [Bacteroidia bacterium]